MISFQVIGANSMAGKFLAATGMIPSAMSEGLDKAALLVTRTAKQKAPVDTGFLRSSIRPAGSGGKERYVVSHAEYSIYQEVGTYCMAAHPYMRPALDENADQIKNILGSKALMTIHGAGL